MKGANSQPENGLWKLDQQCFALPSNYRANVRFYSTVGFTGQGDHSRFTIRTAYPGVIRRHDALASHFHM